MTPIDDRRKIERTNDDEPEELNRRNGSTPHRKRTAVRSARRQSCHRGLVELFCRERVRFRFTPDTAFDVIDFDDDNPSAVSRAREAFEEWKNAIEQCPGHHDKPEQLIPGMQLGMQQRGF